MLRLYVASAPRDLSIPRSAAQVATTGGSTHVPQAIEDRTMSTRHTSTALGGGQTAAATAGEHARWRTLFDDNVYDLYRFLYMWTGNREEAEQLTSRVYQRFVRTLSSTDTTGPTEATRQW